MSARPAFSDHQMAQIDRAWLSVGAVPAAAREQRIEAEQRALLAEAHKQAQAVRFAP